MSFRVFAAGSDHFNFERDNNPDMDIFEAAAVASALRAVGSPTARGVAEGVADYEVPSDASAFREGVAAIAQMQFLHLLKNSVDFLAMCTGVGEGAWISVAPVQSHILWPDTAAFARYDFTPGDNPGGSSSARSDRRWKPRI